MHNGAMTRELLTVSEARGKILEAIVPLAAELVSIDDALDRVLARDLPEIGRASCRERV